MSIMLKRLIYLFGFLLAGASLIFVSISLIQNAEEIDITSLSSNIIAQLFFLSIIYGLLNLLLAFAWQELLYHLGQRVNRTWVIWAYGVSQLAKYVPGNLFQFAGRQAIGVSAGLSNWSLAKSTMWELGTITLMVLPFAFLPLALVFDAHALFFPSLLMFGSCVFIIAFVTRRFFSIHLSRATLIYTAFLLASGLVFTAIVVITLSVTLTTNGLLAICGGYVVAWLAGLITPGAPAGLGIREVVLYALFQTIMSQTDLLLVIGLGRIVTIVGDLLYFFATVFLRTMVVP